MAPNTGEHLLSLTCMPKWPDEAAYREEECSLNLMFRRRLPNISAPAGQGDTIHASHRAFDEVSFVSCIAYVFFGAFFLEIA